MLVVLLARALVPAAETVPRENQIQAVFLWRFAQFISWPTNAFESAESPMIIGVLGENPFGNALALAVKGETAHGRSIEVRHYRRLEEVGNCHILYISNSEEPRLRKVVSTLADKPILTVSAIDGFASNYGGMIRMVVERGRVALRVNVEATKAGHLTVDARLLRLAEVAKSP